MQKFFSIKERDKNTQNWKDNLRTIMLNRLAPLTEDILNSIIYNF